MTLFYESHTYFSEGSGKVLTKIKIGRGDYFCDQPLF